jgi:GNAT superfamily N-acetyltransferase
MEFCVRPGVAEDAQAIARVQVESWRTTYAGIVPATFLTAMDVEQGTRRWRELVATADMKILVAENENGVVGFASGGNLREPIQGYDAELFAIYLLAGSQGKGAGRRLFETMVGWLKDGGLSAMAVWVLRDNPALGFYQHMGGAEIASKMIDIGGALLEEVAYGLPLRGIHPGPPS